MRQPSDAAVRATALDTGHSFLVQAPAGSGKTELLTDRIIALLATVDEPEEIVAITFTKKAAAEMHGRVLEKLRHPQRFSERTRQLVGSALQRSQQLDWDLLQQPQRLRIQTIDSLASHIAHQLPYQSRLGARFATSDDARLLYREAARALLADLERDVPHQAALADLLEHLDNDLYTAEGLLIDMLERRDQWLPLLPAGAADWQQVRAELEGELRLLIGREFEQHCVHLSTATLQQLLPIAHFMAAQLEADGKNHPLGPLRACDEAPEHQLHHMPAWHCLLWLLLKDDGDWRKQLSKTIGLPASDAAAKRHAAALKDILDGLRDDDSALQGLRRLRELPEPCYSDAQWAVLQALFSVLKVAAAYLWLTFQQHGQVDFIEVAARALEALGDEDNPSDLLLALDHRLRHLLVDEFQDTSLSQIRLLTRLTTGWQAGDGRTLFVVGDPMQSIYRFRKAEVSLFLEARHSGIGAISLTALTLTENFRSRAGIVEWINSTFAAVMPPQDDLLAGAIHYSDAIAWHQEPSADGQPAVSLHAHWPDGAMGASLLGAVNHGLSLGPTSSVAILGRTRRQLELSMQVLREAGIPYRAVDLQPLGQQLWIQDLLQLTRALLHPADRLAWLTVLRAPWCGLTLADLDLLCGDDHRQPLLPLLSSRLHLLSDDGRQRAVRVLTILHRHVMARERQPFAVAVAAAWQALGGPFTLPHAAAHDDCRSYLDWLEQQDWPLDLDRIEEKLARLFAAPDPRAEAQRVVVMTMHKSKGLQFDSVLLPALDARGNRDSSRLLLTEEAGQHILFAPVRRRDGQDDDRLYRWLAAKEQQRAQHETGRLLYVAATRGKQHLHLFATVKANAEGELREPPAASLLAQLWPVLGQHFRPPGVPGKAAMDDAEEIPLPAAQRLQRLPLAALPAVIIGDAGGSGFRPVHFQAPSLPAAIGTVVHAWLEQIGRDGVETWDSVDLERLAPLMRQQLRQAGVSAPQLEAALCRVQLALRRSLADAQGRWLLSATHREAHSEWAWLSQDEDGRIQRHIIDRCFVDHTGQRWLIDFKTSAPAPEQPLAAFLAGEAEQYRPQLQTYAALFGGEAVRLGLYFPLLPHWLELSAPPPHPQQSSLF